LVQHHQLTRTKGRCSRHRQIEQQLLLIVRTRTQQGRILTGSRLELTQPPPRIRCGQNMRRNRTVSLQRGDTIGQRIKTSSNLATIYDAVHVQQPRRGCHTRSRRSLSQVSLVRSNRDSPCNRGGQQPRSLRLPVLLVGDLHQLRKPASVNQHLRQRRVSLGNRRALGHEIGRSIVHIRHTNRRLVTLNGP